MCVGHSSSNDQKEGRHLGCSCGLFPRTHLVLLTIFLSCVVGEVAETHKSGSVFRAKAFPNNQPLQDFLVDNVDGPSILHNLPSPSLFDPFEDAKERAKFFPAELAFEPAGAEAAEEETHMSQGKRWGNVIGAVLVILLFTVLGAMIPNALSSFCGRAAPIGEALCQSFAAGAFWGLALLHVMLEAVGQCDEFEVGLFFGKDRNFMNAAYGLAVIAYLGMVCFQQLAVLLASSGALEVRPGEKRPKDTFLHATTTVCAIAVHSIFEGMVLSTRDTILLIWVAAISIIGHKFAVAAAAAAQLRRSNFPVRVQILLIGCLAMATPVGALIGMPLGGREGRATAVVNALSAGILMFAASEAAQDGFSEPEPWTDRGPSENWPDKAGHEYELASSNSIVVEEAESVKQLGTSVTVFFARIVSLLVGAGFIFAMMCVHMENPGHSHGVHEAAHIQF